MKPIFLIFRRRRPDAILTDRGHGGFAFFAHRHCPATQGSTFSARSARRVREKTNRRWPQISNRAKGSSFLHIVLAQRRRVRFFRLGAREGCSIRMGLRFGGPLIECGEYDRPEFHGTDQFERGPRFEAPFQKCVMGTPNSVRVLPERHRSTSGFGILARVAEGFDVFLPVYNAAPPVTVRSGTPWNAVERPGTPWNALEHSGLEPQGTKVEPSKLGKPIFSNP